MRILFENNVVYLYVKNLLTDIIFGHIFAHPFFSIMKICFNGMVYVIYQRFSARFGAEHRPFGNVVSLVSLFAFFCCLIFVHCIGVVVNAIYVYRFTN